MINRILRAANSFFIFFFLNSLEDSFPLLIFNAIFFLFFFPNLLLKYKFKNKKKLKLAQNHLRALNLETKTHLLIKKINVKIVYTHPVETFKCSFAFSFRYHFDKSADQCIWTLNLQRNRRSFFPPIDGC